MQVRQPVCNAARALTVDVLDQFRERSHWRQILSIARYVSSREPLDDSGDTTVIPVSPERDQTLDAEVLRQMRNTGAEVYEHWAEPLGLPAPGAVRLFVCLPRRVGSESVPAVPFSTDPLAAIRNARDANATLHFVDVDRNRLVPASFYRANTSAEWFAVDAADLDAALNQPLDGSFETYTHSTATGAPGDLVYRRTVLHAHFPRWKTELADGEPDSAGDARLDRWSYGYDPSQNATRASGEFPNDTRWELTVSPPTAWQTSPPPIILRSGERNTLASLPRFFGDPAAGHVDPCYAEQRARTTPIAGRHLPGVINAIAERFGDLNTGVVLVSPDAIPHPPVDLPIRTLGYATSWQTSAFFELASGAGIPLLAEDWQRRPYVPPDKPGEHELLSGVENRLLASPCDAPALAKLLSGATNADVPALEEHLGTAGNVLRLLVPGDGAVAIHVLEEADFLWRYRSRGLPGTQPFTDVVGKAPIFVLADKSIDTAPIFDSPEVSRLFYHVRAFELMSQVTHTGNGKIEMRVSEKFRSEVPGDELLARLSEALTGKPAERSGEAKFDCGGYEVHLVVDPHEVAQHWEGSIIGHGGKVSWPEPETAPRYAWGMEQG